MIKYIYLIIISASLISSQYYATPVYINVPEANYATSFTYPIGNDKSHRGYYDAQPFGVNRHLGSDWNATTGGNSDLGKPVRAIANGYVSTSKNYGGGWGNVVRIIHYNPKGNVESLYAHFDKRYVSEGQYVKKGTVIGTIGNCNGKYLAHLHFEIRDNVNQSLGSGYSINQSGYVDPTAYIKARL